MFRTINRALITAFVLLSLSLGAHAQLGPFPWGPGGGGGGGGGPVNWPPAGFLIVSTGNNTPSAYAGSSCAAGQAINGLTVGGAVTGCFTPATGTINSGTAGDIGYYASTGTALSQLVPGNGLSTSGGTLNLTTPPNDQSSAGGAIPTTDNSELIYVGAHTYSLPAAATAGNGWGVCVLNVGATAATLNNSGDGATFKGLGGGTSLTIAASGWACPTSDGTNWGTPGDIAGITSVSTGLALSSGALSLDVTHANAWSGAQALTNTSLTAPAAGSLALGGTAADPTFGANAEGAIYLSTTNGLRFGGDGSTYDFSFINSSGSTVFGSPHNSTFVSASNNMVVGATTQLSANDKLSVVTGVSNKGISFQDSAASGYGYFKMLNDTTTPFFITVNGSTDSTDNCAVVACTEFTVGGGLYISGLTNANAGAYLCRSTGLLIEFDNTACAASLRAVKRDIVPMRGALAEALQLDPIWFRYKPKENDGGLFVHPGLIAEDVAAVDPRLAAYTEKGKLEGVDYSRMSALLVGSVKDLQREIDIDRALIGLLGFCVIVLFWRTRKHA